MSSFELSPAQMPDDAPVRLRRLSEATPTSRTSALAGVLRECHPGLSFADRIAPVIVPTTLVMEHYAGEAPLPALSISAERCSHIDILRVASVLSLGRIGYTLHTRHNRRMPVLVTAFGEILVPYPIPDTSRGAELVASLARCPASKVARDMAAFCPILDDTLSQEMAILRADADVTDKRSFFESLRLTRYTLGPYVDMKSWFDRLFCMIAVRRDAVNVCNNVLLNYFDLLALLSGSSAAIEAIERTNKPEDAVAWQMMTAIFTRAVPQPSVSFRAWIAEKIPDPSELSPVILGALAGAGRMDHFSTPSSGSKRQFRASSRVTIRRDQ